MSEKKIKRAISALMLASLCLSGCTAEGEEQVVATFSREDTTPPEICGVQDLVVYAGDTVRYLQDVTARDDTDLTPSLTVDTGGVDLTTPGTYYITYTAQDRDGNTSRAEAWVTVLEPPEETAELDDIDLAAAALLDEILWPEATTREQVSAIYAWARTHIGYNGHSDRTDWRQTAYTVIQEKQGDCYGYFAVTKLLFEQLGIPNIDVTKVKNSETDSNHFWSLVSVDGGETYYHFDATPRMGEGDDFCLVTDDFLDAYSGNHGNSHNRDQSLYPATPKEALT